MAAIAQAPSRQGRWWPWRAAAGRCRLRALRLCSRSWGALAACFDGGRPVLGAPATPSPSRLVLPSPSASASSKSSRQERASSREGCRRVRGHRRARRAREPDRPPVRAGGSPLLLGVSLLAVSASALGRNAGGHSTPIPMAMGIRPDAGEGTPTPRPPSAPAHYCTRRSTSA